MKKFTPRFIYSPELHEALLAGKEKEKEGREELSLSSIENANDSSSVLDSTESEIKLEESKDSKDKSEDDDSKDSEGSKSSSGNNESNEVNNKASSEVKDKSSKEDRGKSSSKEKGVSLIKSKDKVLGGKYSVGYKISKLPLNTPDKAYVTLVVFRVDKTNPKNLKIKCISYPEIFLNSLLAHLIVRENFNISSTFKDWGDHLTVIDKQLFGKNTNLGLLLSNINELNLYFKRFVSEDRGNVDISTYQGILDIIKKMTLAVDNVSELVDQLVSKDFDTFLSQHFSREIEDKGGKDKLYFIKDCVFVVSNITLLVDNLKSLGYTVKRSNKSSNLVDTSDSFLSSLDWDYRENLYNYHTASVKEGSIPQNCLLSRSKFSFRNVHINLGNVKSYSTLSVTTKRITRQDLFEDNYMFVLDLLKEHSFVGSDVLQRKIELLLQNQEDLFRDSSSLKRLVKYDQTTFDLIEKKKIEISKGVNNFKDKDFSKIKNIESAQYLPLVDKISTELGSDFISDLLISFFFEILDKQTLNVDINSENAESLDISGVSSLKCYHEFGKRIFNKYIVMKRKNSSEYTGEGSLTEFIESIKEKGEYRDVYTNEESYSRIGGYFVYLLEDVDLLSVVHQKHPDNPEYTVLCLTISDKYKSKFLINKRIYTLPQKLPMVCEPKEFVKRSSEIQIGGFLLNDELYSMGLIKPRIGTDKPTLLTEDNILLDMINSYMKTPFKINKEVLDFIYEYGVEKEIVKGNLSDDALEFLENPRGRNKSDKVKEIRSLISIIMMEKNILTIAETFSNVDKIYFPVKLDFRTRIYADTDYFDYQKSDLAKGLLLFANPGSIRKTDREIINYFKAYGANMFGLDKKSLAFRIKWVDANVDRILDFKNNDIVLEAENKACFVAFCFEFSRFIEFMSNNESVIFNTYLPIQLDATCNGYQHLALLTKEKELLNKLNLSESTFNKDPEDFYSYVNDLLYEHVNGKILELENLVNKTDTDNDNLIKYKKVIELNFDRSVLKTVIMRESYSASIPTLVMNILSSENIIKLGKIEDSKGIKVELFKLKTSDLTFTRKDLSFYVMCIKAVISRIAPKIKLLSSYLNSIVSICTSLGIPIPWRLPHGAIISQSYLKSKEYSIKPFTFTKSKFTFKRFTQGDYDSGKQRRALRPNLIHSLDATTIALLYSSMPKGTSLYTVHDCFAVTANNIPMLITKLKLVYIKLYSSNSYLAEFDYMVRLSINNTYGNSIFELDGKYVNIPDKSKLKTTSVEFPNVNDIINIDKKKLKKVIFPDITNVTSSNVDIKSITKAVYPIV